MIVDKKTYKRAVRDLFFHVVSLTQFDDRVFLREVQQLIKDTVDDIVEYKIRVR